MWLELVDALGLEPSGGNTVQVRLLSSELTKLKRVRVCSR